MSKWHSLHKTAVAVVLDEKEATVVVDAALLQEVVALLKSLMEALDRLPHPDNITDRTST